ncbi:MAG TPA: hypothetical protein VH678_03910 [Xanthobacteraceae bacterium]|jgi:hypothetical protein
MAERSAIAIPNEFRVVIFDVPEWPGLLAAGWYWQEKKVGVLRGPFPTEAAARADFDLIGRDLFGIIIIPNEQAAAALLRGKKLQRQR